MPVPPKRPEERRRRNATVPMTQLPAGGRKGAAPKWPLAEATAREKVWWGRLWKLPQAVAWERHRLELVVARYVVVLVAFEAGRLLPPIPQECRQLEDRLGLNPVAMLRLRWEVAADELADHRGQRPASRRVRPQPVDPGEGHALAGT